MANTKQDRKKSTAENDDKQKSKKQVKGGAVKGGKNEKFVEEKVPARLTEFYKTKIVPDLIKKFGYKNSMEAPKLQKIILNCGVGAAVTEPKIIETTVKDIEAIAGQRPTVVKAKKSVSNFKLREGMPIGVRVTLRNNRMYEFLDRLVCISIPRIRDFRGLSDKSFDGRGNYSMGIKEQIIFPEINVDSVTRVIGMDVTFVTTAKTDEESFELLKAFGLPFTKK
ncbi:MAG: 50S ribosomal protein L5 [Ignavibacteriae bacterium]|nr:50S ribosomal protein L5 [Ignavibacteriota bacterium]